MFFLRVEALFTVLLNPMQHKQVGVTQSMKKCVGWVRMVEEWVLFQINVTLEWSFGMVCVISLVLKDTQE
jgi:hypothetical protein